MPLFCKPSPRDCFSTSLYDSADPTLKGHISFRSLQPESDIDFLHTWVNLPYSKKFWQLDGSLSNLYSIYKEVLDNPSAHSFIGLLSGNPVCQVDAYEVAADELSRYVEAKPNDCGLHLLMQPPDQMIRGTSITMLRHFIRFYFSHPDAGILYAEPDKENTHANRLAQKAGMHYLKTIELTSKTANLYSITKAQFHATYSIL